MFSVSLKAEKQDEKLMENMEVNDVTNSKPYQVGNSKLMMVINDVNSPKLYQAGDNSLYTNVTMLQNSGIYVMNSAYLN
jgi:hypothetical protein